MNIVLVDRKDDDILCKDINLAGMNWPIQLDFGTSPVQQTRTHLFSPTTNSALFISIFRHLAEKETIEEMHFALSFLFRSIH